MNQLKRNISILLERYAAGDLQLHNLELSRAGLSDRNLSRIDLSSSDLSKADLRRINLHRAILHNVDFGAANLAGANLSGADLRGANLAQANLKNANLLQADLTRANIRAAELKRVNFSKATVEQALLTGANLSEGIFKGTNLRQSDLSEANLCEAALADANLEQVMLEGAIYDQKTTFPDDFEPVMAGMCFKEPQVAEAPRSVELDDDFESFIPSLDDLPTAPEAPPTEQLESSSEDGQPSESVSETPASESSPPLEIEEPPVVEEPVASPPRTDAEPAVVASASQSLQSSDTEPEEPENPWFSSVSSVVPPAAEEVSLSSPEDERVVESPIEKISPASFWGDLSSPPTSSVASSPPAQTHSSNRTPSSSVERPSSRQQSSRLAEPVDPTVSRASTAASGAASTPDILSQSADRQDVQGGSQSDLESSVTPSPSPLSPDVSPSPASFPQEPSIAAEVERTASLPLQPELPEVEVDLEQDSQLLDRSNAASHPPDSQSIPTPIPAWPAQPQPPRSPQAGSYGAAPPSRPSSIPVNPIPSDTPPPRARSTRTSSSSTSQRRPLQGASPRPPQPQVPANRVPPSGQQPRSARSTSAGAGAASVGSVNSGSMGRASTGRARSIPGQPVGRAATPRATATRVPPTGDRPSGRRRKRASRPLPAGLRVGAIAAIAVATAGLGYFAYPRLMAGTSFLTLQRAKQAKSDGRYDRCVRQASTVASNSNPYEQAQALADRCRRLRQQEQENTKYLAEANQALRDGEFQVAIDWANQVALLGNEGETGVDERWEQNADTIIKLAKDRLEQASSLETIASLAATGRYESCQAPDPPESGAVSQALGSCLLDHIDYLASSGEVQGALDALGQLPVEAVQSGEARELRELLADSLVASATQLYEAGDLSGAISTIEQIPEDSDKRDEAQSTAETWEVQWQTDSERFQSAQSLLNSGQWQAAISEASSVTSPYWANQVVPIVQEAEARLAPPPPTPVPQPTVAPVPDPPQVTRDPQCDSGQPLPAHIQRQLGCI